MSRYKEIFASNNRSENKLQVPQKAHSSWVTQQLHSAGSGRVTEKTQNLFPINLCDK